MTTGRMRLVCPSSVVRHLQLCYAAMLLVGGTCTVSPVSRSASSSLDNGQQQQQQQTSASHTAGVDWQTIVTLLMATSTDAMQRAAQQQSGSSHSLNGDTVLASTIQGWANSVDSSEGAGSGVSRLASEADFVRACCDSIALLHSVTLAGDGALLPALVGSWLDSLESKLPPAAVQQVHSLQQQQQQQQQQQVQQTSEQTHSSHSDEQRADSSAFAISCFVLSEEHSQQAEVFILAAFAALPDREWMLLSAPHDTLLSPIVAHMTQLQPRANSQHEATHAVFAIHRHTAVSALSPAEATVAVRPVESSDLPTLTALLTAQAAVEFGVPDHHSANDAAEATVSGPHSHAERLASSASASSAVRLEVSRVKRYMASGSGLCCMVSCAGECIGVVRVQPLQSSQHLHALHSHYSGGSLPAAKADHTHMDDSDCLLRPPLPHPLLRPPPAVRMPHSLGAAGDHAAQLKR